MLARYIVQRIWQLIPVLLLVSMAVFLIVRIIPGDPVLVMMGIDAEERTRMVRDLNSILGHIDSLNELDTTNVPPMAQVPIATVSINRSREVNASPMPVAKISTKACVSRCPTTSRWRTRRIRMERFSKSRK